MQLNINTIRQMAMALVGAVAVAACGGKDNGTETPSGSGENVAVSISPDRETMYRNPFSGWVIYSGLGDGLSDNFWQEKRRYWGDRPSGPSRRNGSDRSAGPKG